MYLKLKINTAKSSLKLIKLILISIALLLFYSTKSNFPLNQYIVELKYLFISTRKVFMLK